VCARNTTVPVSRAHTFTTVRDNQTSVKILVMQGESKRAEENELLGEFILTGLRRAPKNEVEVEVAFAISADGIVSVSAKDTETGMEQSITVTATSGLTEDEISQMITENRDLLVEQRESAEFSKAVQTVERLIEEVKQLFPKVEEVIAGSDFGQDAMRKAKAVLQRAQAAIDLKDLQAVQESQEALQRTFNMFKGVVSKTRLS
jgi:molecular chaperone DnaK